MTVDEALKHFSDLTIPNHLYQVGGPCGHETIGIESDNGQWSVFFCERGQRDVITRSNSETEAVDRFVQEVTRAFDFWKKHTPT